MKDLRGAGVTRSVSVEIAAPPQEVYAFISDVANLGSLGPETEECWWVTPGEHFRGRNRIGDFVWETDSFVVAAEPGVRFAFEVNEQRYILWSYDLSPTSSGTRLTHWFEIRHLAEAYAKVPDDMLPVRWQNMEDGMTAVLQGIKQRVEAARAVQPA